MEIIGLIVSIVALAVSVISAFYTKRTLKEQVRISKITANYTALTTADALLENNEEWLRLYNVDKELLKQCGISAVELLYLIQSFSAGELYHRIDGSKSISLGKYRENLLRSEKVRETWKLVIRDKFSEYGPFIDEVDKFIHQNYPEQYQVT